MPNDSASNRGFAGLIEKIKIWGGPFIGVALFVFGLRNGVKELQENITWAVATGVSIAWLFLFWIYTSKAEREVWEGIDQQPKIEKVSQYPKLRKWAFAGMVILPLFAVSGFVIAEYVERRPSDKTIILIANFDGDDQKHAVTQTIINRMNRATSEFPVIRIKGLNKKITEQEGSESARNEGRKNKASIVIWGFYDEALTGTVHIELIRETRLLFRHRREVDFSIPIAESRGISVKEKLSGDMNLLALLLVGLARYEVGDYERAIPFFSTALEQRTSPQLTESLAALHFFRGTSFLQKSDYDRAIADFDHAIIFKCNLDKAYYNRGAAYMGKGDYDRAIADYDRTLVLNPKDSDVYISRGTAYADKGDYDRAMADYNYGVTLKSDNARGYYNRGVTYQTKGDFDRAIADYDRAIALNQNYAIAYSGRAVTYAKKGDYDSAMADYDRAISLKPDYAKAYANRGITYAEKGDYDRAMTNFDRAIALNPDEALPYYNRGYIYFSNGDYGRAINDYSQAIAIKPDDAKVYLNRGSAYYEKGDYDRAIADYDHAITLKSTYARAYIGRGLAYERKGNTTTAIADYQKGNKIAISPDERKFALEQLQRLGVSPE